MAATRKLQGEIERCLKKVTEGVETFEDIWQKVHNATNSNQKEKYEADLKKEIKKLQRLRDQIKSWIASAEIKDKSNLLEYRKLIETQMERFKVVERETKTKAYSKEGLGAALKMDPAQKEREEISAWLIQSIDALNLQQDQFESEIESLLAGKKKRLDKDKQDRMDELKTKLDKHRYHIRKLETLLRMLDNMSVEVGQIRSIKDDVEYYIESSQDPDFEGNEYIYDDIIGLDEVELSGVGQPSSATTDSNGSPTSITSSPPPSPPPGSQVVAPPPPAALSAPPSAGGGPLPPLSGPTPGSGGLNHSASDSSVPSEEKRARTANPEQVVVKPMAVRANNISQNSSSNSLLNCSGSSGKSGGGSMKPAAMGPLNNSSFTSSPNNSSPSSGGLLHGQQPAAPPPSSSGTGHTATHLLLQATVSPAVTAPPPSLLLNSVNTAPSNFAAVAAQHNKHSPGHISENGVGSSEVLTGGAHHQPPPSSTPVPTGTGSGSNAGAGGAVLNNSTCSESPLSSPRPTPPPLAAPPPPPPAPALAAVPPPPLLPPAASSLQQLPLQQAPLPPPQQQAPLLSHHQPLSSPDKSLSTLKSIAQQVIDRAGLEIPSSEPSRTSGFEAPSSGVGKPRGEVGVQQTATGQAHIPPLLGVAPLGPVPLQKEHQCQFGMMEAAYYHMPHPADSERVRQYLPRTPCQTPIYYHQVPLPHSDTLEFFQRLSTETLFFIFYYMEGSKAQYLAAKALKKQSWRFHTKYMMWFQRHEEPKLINEEYEQGTYIYFDYEKWGQRKKEGFTFEYKYLEDRDLN